MPNGAVPIENPGRTRRLSSPQDPGREDPVEERLHEGGPEEGRAPIAFKLHAQRFFQGGPQ